MPATGISANTVPSFIMNICHAGYVQRGPHHQHRFIETRACFLIRNEKDDVRSHLPPSSC